MVGADVLSRFFSDNVYLVAEEPKYFIVVNDCNNVDLYDDITKVLFNTVTGFFNS